MGGTNVLTAHRAVYTRYTMKILRMLAGVLLATLCLASEEASSFARVKVQDPKGFSGTLDVEAKGQLRKATVKWRGALTNDSDQLIRTASFCVVAKDKGGKIHQPRGQECLIHLWANNWAPGETRPFENEARIVLSNSKERADVSSIEVRAVDIIIGNEATQPGELSDTGLLPINCSSLWASSIRVFADRRFRPLVLDKESLTATFAFEGGETAGWSSSADIKNFTTASTAFFGPSWQSFRVDSASVYFQDQADGHCKPEVKVAFSGLAKPFLANNYQWYVLQSNFNLEGILLRELATAAKTAVATERDKGIAAISTVKLGDQLPAGDIASQLEALAKMFSSGLLTPDEFQQAKKKLLEVK